MLDWRDTYWIGKVCTRVERREQQIFQKVKLGRAKLNFKLRYRVGLTTFFNFVFWRPQAGKSNKIKKSEQDKRGGFANVVSDADEGCSPYIKKFWTIVDNILIAKTIYK